MNSLAKKEVSANTICAHCGDICLDTPFIYPTHLSFCCAGCETVYNLLHDHDLESFYNFDSKAGLSQKNNTSEQYDYLDDLVIQQKLTTYTKGSILKVWLSLPAIHCSSCLWLLENISRLNTGIQRSTVNFLEKKALIQFDNELISLRELVELLSKIGYPPHISFKETDKRQEQTDKSIYYKLGIAGFVFGNIMLLSFPEYLGMSVSDIFISTCIRYINVVLIIPVVFYCAKDYFLSAFSGLKQKHLNIDFPISIGVFALLGKSLYDIFFDLGPGYLDSLAGLIFFLLIGRWFQNITYNRIKFDLDYKSYFPIAATQLTSKGEQKTALHNIQQGDILRIRHGELIPTDGKLLTSSSNIDYSFVTGETNLIEVFENEPVFSGGKVIGQLAEIKVEKTVSTSYLTQLWDDSSFNKKKTERSVSKINNLVSKYFTITILAIAICSFVVHAISDINMAFNVFTSVLIIACPCAVALSIPFTFGNLLRLLARKNIFFKNTNVVEDCASLSFLVFDKTGTIMQSKHKSISYFGKKLSLFDQQQIVSACNQSTHPKSQMVISFFAQPTSAIVYDFEEMIGMGITGKVGNRRFNIGSKNYLNQEQIQLYEHYYPEAKDSNVYIQIDHEVVGSLKSKSEFVPSLKETLHSLSQRYKIGLISGDNANDKKLIQEMSGNWDSLQFQKSPFEKLTYIKQLKEEGNKVAMIGDGLNDAGSLSQSDVGIAISENTSSFTPASDIIIDATNVESLPKIFAVCRYSVLLIYASYCFAILYNLVGLSFAVQGVLSPVIAAILMPLSSITIVFFGVIASRFLIHYSKL